MVNVLFFNYVIVVTGIRNFSNLVIFIFNVVAAVVFTNVSSCSSFSLVSCGCCFLFFKNLVVAIFISLSIFFLFSLFVPIRFVVVRT